MKRIKMFALASVILTVVFCSTSAVWASDKYPDNEKLVFLSEGYTEDGVHYTIYEDVSGSDDTGIMPAIIVSREKVAWITYDDYITQIPSTYNYSYYDEGYKTEMKGTLYLQSWFYEDGKTHVSYKGTVIGHI